MRLKSKELDQQFRFTARKVPLLDRLPIHCDAERAEQMKF